MARTEPPWTPFEFALSLVKLPSRSWQMYHLWYDASMARPGKTKKTNPRAGGSLDAFLKQEGLYDEVVAQAEKEILAWKLQSAMKEKKMTVSALAKRMQTSRAAIHRILDPA